jgi:hypothetical protein
MTRPSTSAGRFERKTWMSATSAGKTGKIDVRREKSKEGAVVYEEANA